jgi:acyl-CoA thioesterase-1
VVEGGLNDTDQPDAAIERGFHRLMAVLRGHRVLVVGPAPAPLREAGAVHVDALLARLTRAAGVPYLSMVHLSLPYLSDHLHLTPEGHRAFGDRVAGSVGALA